MTETKKYKSKGFEPSCWREAFREFKHMWCSGETNIRMALSIYPETQGYWIEDKASAKSNGEFFYESLDAVLQLELRTIDEIANAIRENRSPLFII